MWPLWWVLYFIVELMRVFSRIDRLNGIMDRRRWKLILFLYGFVDTLVCIIGAIVLRGCELWFLRKHRFFKRNVASAI